MDAHPLSCSAIVRQALIDAWDEPVLLSKALQRRIDANQPTKSGRRCGIRVDGHSQLLIARLQVMAHLSHQEIVRLAVEAYLHKIEPGFAPRVPRP